MHEHALPAPPSLAGYRTALDQLVDAVEQEQPQALLLLSTLPPLGEDLLAPCNTHVLADFNAVVRAAAARRARPRRSGGRVVLVDSHAALVEALSRHQTKGARPPPPPAYDGWCGMATDSNLLRYGLMLSWDAISALHGMHLMPDALHLNDRATDLLTDVLVSALGAHLPE